VPSAAVEAVGLAFALTALITFAVANITPAQAAARAATVQIARLIGNEFGNALIQTFVRVREQVHSNLIGLHVSEASAGVARATTQLAAPFDNRPTGLGEATAQGLGVLANAVRREAYVLAYIDAFWLIAWVSLLGILLVLLLRRPPPNPMTPPRISPVEA
jgi:DHA2 family multidrug resistance protein